MTDRRLHTFVRIIGKLSEHVVEGFSSQRFRFALIHALARCAIEDDVLCGVSAVQPSRASKGGKKSSHHGFAVFSSTMPLDGL